MALAWMFLLATSLCITSVHGLEKVGWIYTQFSFVKLFETPKTQKDARIVCLRHDADLAIIKNKKENDFLKGKIQPNKYYWIGPKASPSKRKYLISGEYKSVENLDWAENEPDMKTQRKGACVHVDKKGLFYDTECKNKHPYICLYHLASVDGNCIKAWFQTMKGPRCNKVFKDPKNWDDAAKACKTYENRSDLSPIADLIMKEDYMDPTNKYWVNIKQEDKNLYKFGNKKQPLLYDNWDGHNNDGEYCVTLFSPEHGQWKTKDCSEKHYFICQSAHQTYDVKNSTTVIDLGEEHVVSKRDTRSAEEASESKLHEHSAEETSLSEPMDVMVEETTSIPFEL